MKLRTDFILLLFHWTRLWMFSFFLFLPPISGSRSWFYIMSLCSFAHPIPNEAVFKIVTYKSVFLDEKRYHNYHPASTARAESFSRLLSQVIYVHQTIDWHFLLPFLFSEIFSYQNNESFLNDLSEDASYYWWDFES